MFYSIFMKKPFLIFAILIAPFFLFSQPKNPAYETRYSLWDDPRNIWEVDARLGKYFPFEERHAYMKVLPQYGIDLRVGRQTDGRDQWEHYFNHPVYGAFLRFEKNNVDSVQYKYRNEYGNEQETWRPLGDCISAGAFINGHLYEGKYWSFDYDLMGGLSFWTRHGDEFIGSVVNVHLAIDAGPTFMIEDDFDFLLRYQFSHSSNAAIRLPNCGINVFSWLAGVRYHPNGRPEIRLPHDALSNPFRKSTALFVSNSIGLLQTNEWMNSYQMPDGTMVSDMPNERPYYFADVVQLGIHRQFHPKFSYDLALDFGWTGETKRMFEKAHQRYYDGDAYFTGDDAIPLMEYSFARGLHLAPSAMFEINYGRFAFCLGGAYYLWHGIYYGTDQKKTWGLPESSESHFEDTYLPPCYRTFYERLGFKYYLGPKRNMFVGSFMKVHEVVIDYAEVTFGMNLFQW